MTSATWRRLGLWPPRQLSVVLTASSGAMSSPEEWYRSLPKVTRGWLTASFATTVLFQLEFISPNLIHLDFAALTQKLEVWRLLTNFCFFGKFGFPFVFSLFFMIRYGQELEKKRFEGRSGDFLWALMLMGLLQVAIAYVLGSLWFLAQAMLSSIVYLWSREYAEQVLSIFGLFNVQAFYFPWVRPPPPTRVPGRPGRSARAAPIRRPPAVAGAHRDPRADGRLARRRPRRNLRRPRLLLHRGRPERAAARARLLRRPRRRAERARTRAAQPQHVRGASVGRRRPEARRVSGSERARAGAAAGRRRRPLEFCMTAR